ncbi:MAG: ADP-ribose-binding protein [Candidatus Asgardarchaeia archaeon]
MKVIKDNIWNYWEKGHPIVIPTNETIKKDGSCVMGRRLASQAKEKVKGIEYTLGAFIYRFGNGTLFLPNNLVAFPVKHNWWEKADLKLIEKSTRQLRELIEITRVYLIKYPIYLPKVGCGNGGLNWKDVEPVLDEYLDDRFVVVDIR